MSFILAVKQLFRKKITSSKHNTIDDTINNSSNITVKTGSKFKYEYGRRFHANDDVAYMLPNDDDESDRIHQQHWILKFALQCNYHAPVTEMLERGIRVLDSGCGPATWTFEMAEAYPQSKFHGVDAARVFPEDIKPGNVELVIGNIAKHIPYPDNTFDYIHQRLLILGLTLADWDSTLKEIMRVLKPGGYIELVEFDTEEMHNIGPLMDRIQDIVRKLLMAKKMPINIACRLEEILNRSGFENCVTNARLLKMNHTDKAGELFWDNYVHVTSNTRAVLALFNPEWEDEKVFKEYLKACGAECKDMKTSIKYFSCYAQKPLE